MFQRFSLLFGLIGLALCCGCIFDGGPGRRVLSFDPENWGTGRPVFSPMEGFGYVDGISLDQRQ